MSTDIPASLFVLLAVLVCPLLDGRGDGGDGDGDCNYDVGDGEDCCGGADGSNFVI